MSQLENGFYDFEGIVFLESLVPSERLNKIQTYEDIRSDDVFIWTYPKAGTNWAADVAEKVLADGDLKKARESKTGAYLEITPPPGAKLNSLQRIKPRTLEELSELPSPRVIMTHLKFKHLPPLLQQGKAKLVYVYRHPKDIAASLHPWINYDLGLRGIEEKKEWNDFIEHFFDETNLFGTWFCHFKSIQEVQDKDSILVLKYEDMKQDLPNAVERIAKFFGKSFSPAVTQMIADSCTFEAAKVSDPDSQLLRKGISGDWKNVFTVAQNEQFDNRFRSVKEEYGLRIDY